MCAVVSRLNVRMKVCVDTGEVETNTRKLGVIIDLDHETKKMSMKFLIDIGGDTMEVKIGPSEFVTIKEMISSLEEMKHDD